MRRKQVCTSWIMVQNLHQTHRRQKDWWDSKQKKTCLQAASCDRPKTLQQTIHLNTLRGNCVKSQGWNSLELLSFHIRSVFLFSVGNKRNKRHEPQVMTKNKNKKTLLWLPVVIGPSGFRLIIIITAIIVWIQHPKWREKKVPDRLNVYSVSSS